MAEVQHPLAKLFNPIPEEELEQLAKDVEKDGLIHEMVLYQQKILDGNTRFEALTRFRREFLESDFRCLEDILIDPDDKAAERYVISANALRRHLSKRERDRLGAKYFLAMPKGKPGPKPAQKEEIARLDNSLQNLQRIQQVDNAQALPTTTPEREKVKEPDKRPYWQNLDEAAEMSGGTPGGIRAQVAQITQEKKDPEGVAARAAGKKPPRAPRKPKPAVMEFKDGHTLGQVFHEMFKNSDKTLEVWVKSRGRALFTLDADVQKPTVAYMATESEIIEIAAAQDPPISKTDALDMLDSRKSGGKTASDGTYRDWAAALRKWRNRGWLLSQRQKSQPSPQRAPQGRRSTVLTPAQANAAAAEQRQKMKASLEGEDSKWSQR
jgi:hypothetical protein